MPSENGGGGTSRCSAGTPEPRAARAPAGAGACGWRAVAGAHALREQDERQPPAPAPGRLIRPPSHGCVRSSTTRCISRSHIAWNTCSRCPMTAATFRVTM